MEEMTHEMWLTPEFFSRYNDGKHHHLVIKKDGKTAEVYMDGKKTQTMKRNPIISKTDNKEGR